MSGCSRKFSSCGTRSPARTRRCPLIRLRIGSFIEILLRRNQPQRPQRTQRNAKSKGEHISFFLLFFSVLSAHSAVPKLTVKASTTPHSEGSTTFLFLSPAARLPEPDDRAIPLAAGR